MIRSFIEEMVPSPQYHALRMNLWCSHSSIYPLIYWSFGLVVRSHVRLWGLFHLRAVGSCSDPAERRFAVTDPRSQVH